jgi:molybdenum cofactor synthesis domain-containing protein
MANVGAVILAVGREILRGRIQDSNSGTLARHLTGLGFEVVRIASCDDDVAAIVREIRRGIQDGARLIVTTGGLGPTDDDLTLSALAQAVDRPLALDEQARRIVASRYTELHRAGLLDDPGMTPTREKMAWIPQGARALHNPVGAAPGIWLDAGAVMIVALPGVPAEMAAILESSVLPDLASQASGAVYAEQRITTRARDESVVAPVLRRIGRDQPGVFLKSHPTHYGADVRMEVFASTWAADHAAADEVLARVLGVVREALGEAEPSHP